MSTAPAEKEAPTTTLAKFEPGQVVQIGNTGIVLKSLDDLVRFAERLHKEQALPKGMNVGSAVIAIQAGLQCGLGLMGGLQYGKVINGRFGWMGEGVQAILDNSPKVKPGSFDFWFEGKGDEEFKAVATAWRVGYDKPFTSEFGIRDAKIAQLWGKEGPWRQYPRRMLKWRAVGFLGRDRFADLMGGFPLADELRDHPEMTARVVSQPIERPALPPPAHDPLMDLVLGKAAPKEAPMIEVEACRNPTSQDVEKLQPPPDDGLEDEPEFVDHLEADRALAEEERKKEEAKQRDLFGSQPARDPRLR